jgi:argininosuccinate lyase
MLGKQGILTAEDADLIIKGLSSILEDIRNGSVEFEVSAEDIHMNVEQLLIGRIGEAGKKLHTGRSRNDQIARNPDVRQVLHHPRGTLNQQSFGCFAGNRREHTFTVMPGYTHMQKAQPITLGHHAMAYFQMFLRDAQRFIDSYSRADVMPLGSGALAGTVYPLDRNMFAKELGFSQITLNSLDPFPTDRDFCIEFVSNASLCMMHLSRYCEELIVWSSNEFGFAEMDDAYSTGSSIMPQKKTPMSPNWYAGKTGRVYGDLMALLTVMKSLPLPTTRICRKIRKASSMRRILFLAA